MRVLVVGATGGTGKQLVQQALDQGHDVTAFARDPRKVTLTHSRFCGWWLATSCVPNQSKRRWRDRTRSCRRSVPTFP